MNAIVIHQGSWFERLGLLVIGATPLAVRRLFTGPANRLVIEGKHVSLGGRRQGWRPVDVLVSPGDVLKRRMQIPVEGRADVKHAIALFVRSVTPFDPSELLIYAAVEKDRADSGALSYAIHMLPRDTVIAALRQQKLPRRLVRSIVLNDASAAVDFVQALTPSRRWRKWLPALPILVLLVAASVVCADRLNDLSAREAALEDQTSQHLAHFRALANQLDKQRLAGATQEATAQAFAAAQSAFLLLTDIRSTLPEGTELIRIELRQDGARLTIRTPNALRDAKTFAAALPSRDVSIDGGISADPATGLENAVILLRPRS